MSCCCSSDRSGAAPARPLSLAMTTVPIQPCKALKTGTIFQSLNLPFYVTGGEANG